jgi:hypothetical protein
MEIAGEGLMLGAGTVCLPGWRKTNVAARASRSTTSRAPRRYSRRLTAGGCGLLAKLRRAAELWNDGEKALAHIHLAHADLPPCGPDRALRLFVADELIEAGVTPETLMKSQGFDLAPLALLKANFNPAQPRWAKGSGRDSGRWSGGASVPRG